MSIYSITKFLDIKEGIVKEVHHLEDRIEIFLTSRKPRPKKCPYCGSKTLHYHDRRIHPIKDIPYNHKPVIFLVGKIRYQCPHCKKKSEKKLDFVMKKS